MIIRSVNVNGYIKVDLYYESKDFRKEIKEEYNLKPYPFSKGESSISHFINGIMRGVLVCLKQLRGRLR